MGAPRLLRASLGLLAGIIVLEGLSFGVGTLLFGTGFFTRSREERARSTDARANIAGDVELPSSLREFVLHPYLGFVADEAATTGPGVISEGRLVPTELGFFRRKDAPVPTTADPLRVGIFGGSVAFMFGMVADQALARAVASSPAAGGREVVIENYALPGFKQPQQLFTLVYLLLLGRRIDVAINLDGFNELVLPVTENLAQESAALYPRSWSLLAAASGGGLLAAIADRSDEAALRRVLARTFSVPIVRSSYSAALLWRALDDALAVRIASLDAQFTSKLAARVPAALRGPPTTPASAADPLPELARVWRESSLLMQQICAANGIAYVHALQPNQYLPGSKPLAPREVETAFRADHPYRALVERGYPLLAEQGRRLQAAGVRFVDLSMVFSGVTEPIYVDDCCHFGTRGDLLVAAPLATAVSGALTP